MKKAAPSRLLHQQRQIPAELLCSIIALLEALYLYIHLGSLLFILLPIYALFGLILPSIALLPLVIPMLILQMLLSILGIRVHYAPNAGKPLPPLKSQFKTLLVVVGLSTLLD